MKPQRLSTKRRPVRKGGVSTLFANVARNKKKRHRASTTADAFEGDVPNLGVARALAVILVIHVVAIGGIFVHSRWFDDGDEPLFARKAIQVEPAQDAVGAGLRDEGVELPKIRQGGSPGYSVGTGDTYAGIASRLGVSEQALREANANLRLREGRSLIVPPKKIVAVEPPEFAELRGGRQLGARSEAAAPVASAPADPVPAPPKAIPVQPELIATDAARAVDARNSDQPAAAPASSSAGTARYAVKPGDTLWAIAQKHGVDVNKLMEFNGVSDARKLKIGMELRIP